MLTLDAECLLSSQGWTCVNFDFVSEAAAQLDQDRLYDTDEEFELL